VIKMKNESESFDFLSEITNFRMDRPVEPKNFEDCILLKDWDLKTNQKVPGQKNFKIFQNKKDPKLAVTINHPIYGDNNIWITRGEITILRITNKIEYLDDECD
jgi:hypothetical protein